jgi:hypothetical protein
LYKQKAYQVWETWIGFSKTKQFNSTNVMETVKEFSTPLMAILNLIGYWFLYTYQKSKISHLENGMNTQKELLKTQGEFIKGFEEYRKLLDVEDFNKKLKFQLELKEDELRVQFKGEIGNIFNFANERYSEANEIFLESLNEMLSHIYGLAQAHLKDDFQTKYLRDAFFVRYFPKSSKILIDATDGLYRQEQAAKKNPEAKD